jgi:hypothetical protein
MTYTYSVFIPETQKTITRHSKRVYTHVAVVVLRYNRTVSAWRNRPMLPIGTITGAVTFHQSQEAAVRGERALASRYRNGWKDLFDVVASYIKPLGIAQ